ncbi:MAG: hypothetical protein HKN32_01740 [Flavobacteriales bacterium]|nr:hypothetical protein [Flavobacteriales bacterium]
MSEEVDINRVFEKIVDDLGGTIQNTNATVEVGDMPKVFGNDGQIYRLFLNLMSNALKFKRDGVPPAVTVSYSVAAQPEVKAAGFLNPLYAQYHKIEVRDNGIGFDQEYLSKIFTIFQRLNGRNEFKGTGIGLAICQKIVNNHGGFITAEGKLDEGATFFVFLPKHNKSTLQWNETLR